jgi:putative DeoR family transcriptional regulator (stage III sporulation protein D)
LKRFKKNLTAYIEERAKRVAEYIINGRTTVREAAKKFGVSKSTVHKDLTIVLVRVDMKLAKEARNILEINKSERHIRGGLATREKCLREREEAKVFLLSPKVTP